MRFPSLYFYYAGSANSGPIKCVWFEIIFMYALLKRLRAGARKYDQLNSARGFEPISTLKLNKDISEN